MTYRTLTVAIRLLIFIGALSAAPMGVHPHAAAAQELPDSQTSTGPASQDPMLDSPTLPPEPDDGLEHRAELYFALQGFRSRVNDLTVKDTSGQSLKFPVEDGWGGGAKVGVYIPPQWIISPGVEVETYLFRNAVMAPDASQGLNSTPIKQHLEVWNIMLNLVVRYPGKTLQPYIGVGFGASGVEIRGGRETLFSQTDAYQFFGGIRTIWSKHWFTFAEYKMIYANYQYDCDPKPCLTQNLNYNAFLKPASQYISLGVGVRF